MGTDGDLGEPAALADAVAERLPAILDEVRESLAERHPGYAEFVAMESEEVLGPAREFIRRLLGSVHPGPGAGPDSGAPIDQNGLEQALFEEIGREHCRQGEDITALLAAYRIGAAVAWRHVTEAATHVGVAVEFVPELAGTVFAAVDELSSASLRGFLVEQSDAVCTRDRHRAALVELLLSDRCDSAAVTAAAARAEWALPRRAAIVFAGPDNEVAHAQLARLGESCLQLHRPDAVIAVVADPSGPGQRRRLGTVLGGTGVVVGETVALDDLPASLHVVEVAARLRGAGRLRAERDPLFVSEHLAGLLVHHDENLLARLRRAYLAPLSGVSRPTRDRLEPTLRCWLEQMGNQKAVAAQLHVHPQTVRYRIGQLRDLFGPALDEPASRAALLVALAWGGPVGAEPAAAVVPARGPEPARQEPTPS